MESDADVRAWLFGRPSLSEERNHPNHWFNRASDLHASAGAVWHSMGADDEDIAAKLELGSGFSMGIACRPVYFMLCGLALELILKAVLVQRNGFSKDMENHHLPELAKKVDPDLDDAATKLLRFYEASLVWAGRYPVPRKVSDKSLLDFWKLASSVLTSPVSGVNGIRLMQGNDTADWENFTRLWRSYAAHFRHA